MDIGASGVGGYPLVLTALSRIPCVVIGGGRVAERRVTGLIACGAEPLIVSPELTQRLQGWCEEGKLRHRRRRYRSGDLAGASLAIAATSDPQVNERVAAEAEACGILVNVATSPHQGHFQIPATARSGRLLVSVSTGGTNPGLAAHLRDELASSWTADYALLLEITTPLRAHLRSLSNRLRSRFWREIADPECLAGLRLLPVEAAREHALTLIRALQSPETTVETATETA